MNEVNAEGATRLVGQLDALLLANRRLCYATPYAATRLSRSSFDLADWRAERVN